MDPHSSNLCCSTVQSFFGYPLGICSRVLTPTPRMLKFLVENGIVQLTFVPMDSATPDSESQL